MDLDFSNKVVPVVVQDAITDKVLAAFCMCEKALEATEENKIVMYYSEDEGKIKVLGEENNSPFVVREMYPSSDKRSLLIKAVPSGENTVTLFGEKNDPAGEDAEDFLSYLESVVEDRKVHPQPGSYTNKLFDSGINRVAQKVGEEAVELVIESKDDNEDLFLGEAADLMYHYIVLLVKKGYTLSSVVNVLKKRHKR